MWRAPANSGVHGTYRPTAQLKPMAVDIAAQVGGMKRGFPPWEVAESVQTHEHAHEHPSTAVPSAHDHNSATRVAVAPSSRKRGLSLELLCLRMLSLSRRIPLDV